MEEKKKNSCLNIKSNMDTASFFFFFFFRFHSSNNKNSFVILFTLLFPLTRCVQFYPHSEWNLPNPWRESIFPALRWDAAEFFCFFVGFSFPTLSNKQTRLSPRQQKSGKSMRWSVCTIGQYTPVLLFKTCKAKMK